MSPSVDKSTQTTHRPILPSRHFVQIYTAADGTSLLESKLATTEPVDSAELETHGRLTTRELAALKLSCGRVEEAGDGTAVQTDEATYKDFLTPLASPFADKIEDRRQTTLSKVHLSSHL
ncbi:hypothetical protein JCM6882_008690 [Rhodosporidiobolus microsporus]